MSKYYGVGGAGVTPLGVELVDPENPIATGVIVTIEAAITYYLRTTPNVTQYVTTFSGSPSIFSDVAPQQAQRPYLVFDAQRLSTENLGVDSFLIDIDIYSEHGDAVNTRALALAVEFALDRKILNCDNYKTIRFAAESEGHVDNRDIKVIHYNMQFSARGSRFAWMQQIT